MKRSKEELGRIHKEKCKELKAIRAKIAEDLGIDLQQKECTYEGYCSGTCPKCKSEEMRLNLAIMKRQMEEAGVKRRVAAAGLTTVAALSLTGCNIGVTTVEGAMEAPPSMEQLEGDVACPETFEDTQSRGTEQVSTGTSGAVESLAPDGAIEGGLTLEQQITEIENGEVLYIPEGDIAYTEETTWELQGEVPEMEEATH